MVRMLLWNKVFSHQIARDTCGGIRRGYRRVAGTRMDSEAYNHESLVKGKRKEV